MNDGETAGTPGTLATLDRLSRLADELGVTFADWWQWVAEFGPDVVTAGVVAFDCDSLPFMGEGA